MSNLGPRNGVKFTGDGSPLANNAIIRRLRYGKQLKVNNGLIQLLKNYVQDFVLVKLIRVYFPWFETSYVLPKLSKFY
jgi:hypothetical protein